MTLTSSDIYNKGFRRAFRGYDMDEVNDFLDQVVKDFELLTRERSELDKQIEDLQNELERVLDRDPMFSSSRFTGAIPRYPGADMMQNTSSMSVMEQNMHNSMRVAQEVAEEVRINAKKEAEIVIQEAEKNADRMINDALQKSRAIHAEIVSMKQKSQVYRARFRALVQSHMEILDNSDWDSLDQISAELSEYKQMPVESLSKKMSPASMFREESVTGPQYEMPLDGGTVESKRVDSKSLDEVAAAFSDDKADDTALDLKRSSRKLRRKAMF